MRTISDTITRMQRFQRTAASASVNVPTRLEPLTGFGSNPGHLKAYRFVPEDGLRKGAGLVVVLHGCGQTAAGYDHGSGWSHLAEEHGFVVLYPEQVKTNNAHGCFNWFDRSHNRREAGEASSIRQMVAFTLEQYPDIDPNRIFVTGLSAGGAMTAVMLATYPDVFAGGAIIAGLPYGTAHSIPQAFDRMRGHGFPEGSDLENLIRNASQHQGSWPLLSIWHGSADTTVVPANADAILSQWRGLHEVDAAPSYTEIVNGHSRAVWLDPNGREVIERYDIASMGHGTPLDVVKPSHEVAGAYMLDADISSTRHIAAFWGIAPPVTTKRRATAKSPSEPIRTPVSLPSSRLPDITSPPAPPSLQSIRGTIETALRKAGLMQ